MWPFDVVLDAVNWIFIVVYVIPDLFVYAFQVVFTSVSNPAIQSINLVITIVNLPISIGDTTIAALSMVFVDVLPQQAISYVLIAQLTAVILFRAYHFVKDVSIAGFKV